MRVVVSGAAGFLGMEVCQQLIETGHEVIGLDRRARPGLNENQLLQRILVRRGDLQPGQLIPDKAWNLVPSMHAPYFAQLDVTEEMGPLQPADVCGPASVEELPTHVDAVIHLAGRTGIEICAKNPAEALRVNVGGTLRVLQWCQKYNVPRFVFASSCAAEPDPATGVPRSLYGLSKLQAEMLVLHFARRYHQPASILRLHALYGPHAPASNSVMAAIRDIDSGNTLLLRHAAGVTTRRAWLWIEDAAAAVVEAATRNAGPVVPEPMSPPWTYNPLSLTELSGTRNVSWDVILHELVLLLVKSTARKYEPMGLEDTESFSVASSGRLPAPPMFWSTGLARTVEWYRQQNPEDGKNASNRQPMEGATCADAVESTQLDSAGDRGADRVE